VSITTSRGPTSCRFNLPLRLPPPTAQPASEAGIDLEELQSQDFLLLHAHDRLLVSNCDWFAGKRAVVPYIAVFILTRCFHHVVPALLDQLWGMIDQ